MNAIQNIKIKFFIFFLLITLTPLAAWAQTDTDDEEKIWNAKAGVKEIVSSGLYSTTAYTKPYAGAQAEWNYLFLSAGTAGMIQYSLYDANGNEKKVNLYQLNAMTGLVDFYHVSAYIQYAWNGGESSYKRHDITASIELYFNSFYINGEYSFGNNNYDFNGSLDMNTYAWSAEAGYDITDSLSADLGFSCINNSSDSMDIDYTRRSLRTGATIFWNSNIFLLSGLSYGWDTNDYTMYGADIALSVLIAKYVKLSAMYLISYNSGAGIVSQGSVSGSGVNLVDGSYLSHSLILGAEFRI